jgi:hypothetical protein
MSVKIVFECPVERYKPTDRCALQSVLFDRSFEALTSALKVQPLSKFYSSDPSSLDHQIDDPVERERLKLKHGPAEFFQPSDGLITVRTLLTYLKQEQLGPIPGNRRKNLQSELVAELGEVEQSLVLGKV